MDVAIAHPHVVSLFLDRGLVKADESGARHLIAAAKGNRVDTCEALMRRWCSASAASAASAALSIAAQEGFLTLCASLLKLGGANVNTASERRPSALYCAASRGRGDVCELLLDNGADVELGTRCGQTPLHVAARVGYPRVCEILLAAGAKQSQHPPQGMPERGKVGPDDADTHSSDVEVEASGHATGTPLCVAVKESRWDVCAVLLKYGATHDCDRSGRTPLSHAAVRSCEGCRTLLKYGATHDADDRGKTPLDHATEARRDDICKILVQHIVSC